MLGTAPFHGAGHDNPDCAFAQSTFTTSFPFAGYAAFPLLVIET